MLIILNNGTVVVSALPPIRRPRFGIYNQKVYFLYHVSGLVNVVHVNRYLIKSLFCSAHYTRAIDHALHGYELRPSTRLEGHVKASSKDIVRCCYQIPPRMRRGRVSLMLRGSSLRRELLVDRV